MELERLSAPSYGISLQAFMPVNYLVYSSSWIMLNKCYMMLNTRGLPEYEMTDLTDPRSSALPVLLIHFNNFKFYTENIFK
jgi:hypothetical protein